MIVIKIQGRLGNQMFQYAFAKNMQKKYYPNDQIVINYSKSRFSNKCNFCDDNVFNFPPLQHTNKLHINLIQKIVFYLYTLLKLLIRSKKLDIVMQPFLNYFGIYYLNDPGLCDFKKSKMKNKLIYGYFASEKYFFDIKDEVKEDFKFNIKLDKKKKEFYNSIINSNSVCLSIRRGDYLDSNIKDYYYVCDNKYYFDAIKQAKKDIKDPVFFVFSDDIEWVKNNINIDGKCLYEDSNNTVYDTLYFMKSCKHFIISNSTFHWWAQYLGEYNKKKVYAPSKWNNLETRNEIYLDSWKIIKLTKDGDNYEKAS